MPIVEEPDLERGDAPLKVPPTPFPPPSASPKSPPHQSRNQLVKRKPHPSQPNTTHHRQSHHQPTPHDPNAIPPKLLKFRTILGVSTPSSLLSSTTSSSKNPFSTRPAPNLGIYTRIIHEEISAKRQFYFAASIINICYFGQICIAAALTALGASGSSNIAITVLGATNTVLAGILTYLKGQGLPNRLRMYWTGLRKCREFMEEKERVVAAEGWGWGHVEEEGIDVDEVIDVCVKMYHDVRQNAEDNTPDTFLPMKGSSAKALANNQAPKQTVAYPDEDFYDDESENENDNEAAVIGNKEENGNKPENGDAIHPESVESKMKKMDADDVSEPMVEGVAPTLAPNMTGAADSSMGR
ncbi:MAG: hypothetical protein LQ337_002231 [Flavoplaca oasis]|nr:MAG: hypothetical protein LQ337_002231 [Flavoplaca oasis]